VIKANDDDDEADEDFDIDDVYTNDKIPSGVWDNYIKYLEILGSYLKEGSKRNLSVDAKRILIRKSFRAALKLTNA